MKCDTNLLERNVVLSSELSKATHLILVPHGPPLRPERARNVGAGSWQSVRGDSLRMAIPLSSYPFRMSCIILYRWFVKSKLKAD